MAQNNIRTVLEKHPVIPVVTFHSLSEVDSVIEKLKNAGINCIEITLRTDVAFDAIKTVKEKYGSWMSVGVGTLVDEEQLKAVKSINVDFIVCPGLNYHLIEPLNKSGIAYIPGVATPTEIMNGMQHGLDTFKFFPANLFGGLEALKTYGQVFPSLKFCPTGGINASTYKDYLELSNIISVGGSWMMK
jgi:2-dehydro-3-deoxyphosphogluconate aldolase / (4S)-4-hydroxy-2-oxoglutarate aldolase